MRHLTSLAIALVAASAIGCAGSGTNAAKVYDAQTGTIQLKAATTDSTIHSVTYKLDGSTVLGSSSDAASGFAYNFDTTGVANGVHTVQGTADNGTIIVDNTIFINNTGSATGGSPTGGTQTGTTPTAQPTTGSQAVTPPPSPAASTAPSTPPSGAASTLPSASPSAGF